MAREIANTSLDFRGVPHLLARPSKQDPDGVVVWQEIQPIIDQLQQKLDAAQLAIELQKNNAGVIKRFTLTGGTSETRIDDADGESYTFTSFRISTGFKDSAGNPTVDFEDFAMAASLAPWSNQGFRYEFHKEAPDVAVIEFQSILGAFPDNTARISLALIPEAITQTVIAVLGQRYVFKGGASVIYRGDSITWTNPDSTVPYDGGTTATQLKVNPDKGAVEYINDGDITFIPVEGNVNLVGRRQLTLAEYQAF